MFDDLELLGIALCCVGAAFVVGFALVGIGCRMEEW